jgi:hypothetical protein
MFGAAKPPKIPYVPGQVEALRSPSGKPVGLAQNFNGYRVFCVSKPDGLSFGKHEDSGLTSIPTSREVDLFKSNVSAVAETNPDVKAFLAKNPKFWSSGPL